MSTASSAAFDWIDRANRSIAHGSLTNSKRPSVLVRGVSPTHAVKAQGAHIWASDGKKYIDYIGALGANLLGYAHEEVTRAICEQAGKGVVYSLGSTLEVECAEKIKEMFPWVERVRFLKTGSEACTAAMRIARAHSKKKYAVSVGYHGWHDEFTALTPPALGVNAQEYISTGWERDGVSTGACIVEPIQTDLSPARIAEIQALKLRCEADQVPLIFDEVITGFRFPKWSASRHLSLEPDLIVLGKAIANGMPLSVVAGKADIMEGSDYFVSSTFAGETLSLASALATMKLLQTRYKVEELWAKGEIFLREFNALWPEGLSIQGYPTRGMFRGSDLNKALFWQESAKAGILFGPSWFFNFANAEHSAFVLSTSKDILGRIKQGLVKLEGELPQAPYSQKARS